MIHKYKGVYRLGIRITGVKYAGFNTVHNDTRKQEDINTERRS